MEAAAGFIFDVEGVSGRYFKDRKEIAPAPAALDEQIAARLWEISEQLVEESGQSAT